MRIRLSVIMIRLNFLIVTVAIDSLGLPTPASMNRTSKRRPARRRLRAVIVSGLTTSRGLDLQPPAGAILEVVKRGPPAHRADHTPAPF